MKDNYRIINKNHDGPNIHWANAMFPTENDISQVAQNIVSESPRDPLNQQNHDTLLIQQRLRLLGWKTDTVVNLFDLD